MKISVSSGITGMLATTMLAGTAFALPISISAPYQFLDNVTANMVGIEAGLRQQFDSTCVVLVGNPSLALGPKYPILAS